jgi:hypothetical protein
MANVKQEGGSEPIRTAAGDELSPADLEALAAEAEGGYDLSTAKPERVGRPSLQEGISPRVSFRIGQGLYDAAHTRAEQEGRTVSELAREAMERYIRDL